MMKYLATEQHDSSQAQDKEVIKLEESYKEKTNSVKRTIPNKNIRYESFLIPYPSFKLKNYDSNEEERRFN
jgi:hypothetical protein